VLSDPYDDIGFYTDNHGQAPMLLISVWDFNLLKPFVEPKTYHKKGVEI
jgi:hypothetical protein